MSTKDRLAELHGFGIEDETKKNKTKMKPKFERTEIIMKWINAVHENTDMCDNLLNKGNNDKETYKKLQTLLKSSETISHNIATSLKEFGKELETENNKNTAEYRMRLVQYMGLKDQFKAIIQNHQDCVNRHRDIRKDFLRKCKRIKDGYVDEEILEELVDKESTQLFNDNYLMSEQEAKRMLADVETRHQELLAIESHLVEVHDLFIKIAQLVELQQESINRVEYHADLATEYMDNTVDNLQEAEKKKKSASKMKIILITFGVILLIVIILAFFVR